MDGTVPNIERRRSYVSIWLAWMLVNCVGGLLAQVLTGVLGERVALLTFGALPGAIIFFMLGIGQALLIRRYVINVGTFPILLWALASGVGGCVSTIVGFWIVILAIASYINAPALSVIIVAIVGTTVGGLLALCQSLLLAQYTRGTVWWILGNSVGWSFASLLGVFIVAPLYQLPAYTYFLRGTAPGLWSHVLDIVNTSLAMERIIYGTIVITIASAYSGIALVWLVMQQSNLQSQILE